MGTFILGLMIGAIAGIVILLFFQGTKERRDYYSYYDIDDLPGCGYCENFNMCQFGCKLMPGGEGVTPTTKACASFKWRKHK